MRPTYAFPDSERAAAEALAAEFDGLARSIRYELGRGEMPCPPAYAFAHFSVEMERVRKDVKAFWKRLDRLEKSCVVVPTLVGLDVPSGA